MNKFITLACVAFASAVLLLSAPAFAASQPGNYAIVDMNKVMRETQAAAAVRTELNAKSKQFHLELEKLDKDLRADNDALVKTRSTLSETDFAKKRQELQTKSDSAERLLQDRRKTLDFASNSSRSKLLNEATKIIADIAKERSYSTVFTQEAVLLAEPTLDITDEVVKRMNANVKQIAIDWSPAKAPAKQ